MNAASSEASPLVRKEVCCFVFLPLQSLSDFKYYLFVQIIAALQWVVLIFEYTFVQVALQQLEEERNKDGALLSPNSQDGLLTTSGTQSLQRPTRHRTRTSNPSNLGTSPELPESGLHMSASTGNLGIRRAVSSNSLNSLGKKLTLLPTNT